MAELTTEERKKIHNGLMRFWSNDRMPILITKDDLQAAINATDTWIEDNTASFNQSLPAVARADLTLAQKTFLFCVVALARVSIPFLRLVIGEVD